MTLALALSIFVFLTIVVIVFAFGAASVAPSSVLGSRLREIGWQRPKAQTKPAIRERMQQALDPLSRALPLSPTDVSQTRAWLIQSGYRDPQHVTIYSGLRVLFEALRNLADRTGVDDIRALVATLIQTDRFGTSVAQALRVHSDSLRTERRQRAEEQAAKTTVKMIIPLVLFVMPSLIFVTVGPAIIEIVRTLMPEMRR